MLCNCVVCFPSTTTHAYNHAKYEKHSTNVYLLKIPTYLLMKIE